MQKNILILICDQLSARALKAYGNTDSRTPAIDRLAAKGVVFAHAYTTCPLCQPARASFWSSTYPHENGVVSNLPRQAREDFPGEITCLGELFSQKGYVCTHFGKDHAYGALRGFNKIAGQEVTIPAENPNIPYGYESYFDMDTSQRACAYLEGQAGRLLAPFLTVVDLQNPHNICAYIGAHADGRADYVAEGDLPSLPPNFIVEDMATRAGFFQYLCCGHRRQCQTQTWQDSDFRHYLYAYYHYLERVDRQIGQIMEALDRSGKAKETLVVFMADHGEGMAAHKIVTKSATFYEETVQVPFILVDPGLSGGSGSNRYQGLTSLLDLLPTLADYAGLAIPASARGKSHWQEVKKQVRGHQAKAKTIGDKADYVVSQWHDEFEGYFVPARMYRDHAYKYMVYQDKKGLEEEFYDMVADPWEEVNLSHRADKEDLVNVYRQRFKAYCQAAQDPFYQLRPAYAPKYRRHPVGAHRGDNAVLDYQRKENHQDQEKKIGRV